MTHKLKISFWLLAVLAAGLAGFGTAQAADLNFSVGTAITIGSNTYNIDAGSEATSMTIDTNTLTVTVASGDTFVLGSPDRFTLSNDLGISQVCNAGNSALTITGAATAVITPDTSERCPSSGGGGGGGNDDDSTPAPAPTPAPSEMTLQELQTEITRITALIANLQALIQGAPAGLAAPAVCSVPFNANLYYGLTNNPQVKRLQEFLISKGHLAAGYNTGNYYSLTATAVGAYQASKGITPVPKSFGPLTRAAANADCGF